MIRTAHNLVFTLACVLCVAGCTLLDTQLILDEMNRPPGEEPRRPPARERAERIAFAAVVDAYFDQAEVSKWLEAAAANPAPIAELYAKLLARRKNTPNPVGPFIDAVLPPLVRTPDGDLKAETSAWGIPAPAACLEPPAEPICEGAECLVEPQRPPSACPDMFVQPGAKTLASDWSLSLIKDQNAMLGMIDAERFAWNVASIAPSLVALRNVAYPVPSDAELIGGVSHGLRHAVRYLRERRWPRKQSRPRTALVLSGGAGTGAFQAGFVNRLLGVLQKCNDSTCKGAGIDLVVGTSTGSLVGMIVDMFHVPAREDEARELLREKYTCSVENDLYCGVSEPIHKLAKTVPGLVDFDGIEELIETHWTEDLNTNDTEFVTMSVNYETGELHTDSDQDPLDGRSKKARVASMMGSIVEPLMAYPVRELYDHDDKPIKGTFIDGGIRSGLPVMQAMRRGASRVITVSTSSLDPAPIPRPHDAVKIVLRTIDLMVEQPRSAEAQQTDLAATARRMGEYNVCERRYRAARRVDKDADRDHVDTFCRRSQIENKRGFEAAAAGWTAASPIEQVASSWQSAWVYRSEKPIKGMAGYQFDPKGMRELYLQGVDTFQDRCEEILDMLSLPDSVIQAECKANRGELRAEEKNEFKDLALCQAKKREPRRLCE